MKIAVIGAGVAGLAAAYRLRGKHDVTVFEKDGRAGGHSHTVDVEVEGKQVAVDTGFIVFNEPNYPGFCGLLKELGVAWESSDMSLSVRCEAQGIEYNGASLTGLLARRRNALSPAFWSMLRGIVRFYREAPSLVAKADDYPTIGEYLEAHAYGRPFIDYHLVPMSSAIWSCRPGDVLGMPTKFLVGFFLNHRLTDMRTRPTWLTVKGGSRSYVAALCAALGDSLRTGTAVARVSRSDASGATVTTAAGESIAFDRVVFAVHANIALRMIDSPSRTESGVLGAFSFQTNRVTLHTDTAAMPDRRRTWASWNCRTLPDPASPPSVTYWMNNLQRLGTDVPIFVSLNSEREIDPASVLGENEYSHPVYSLGAVGAQARHAEIDGADAFHFCGAYWGAGFHEDGVRSAAVVAEKLACT